MKAKPLTDEAFEKLFKAFYRPLTVYAMQFIHEQELAEDLVQDLFLHIYEKKASLNNIELNNHYLYRAVHNRCVNNLSYQKLRNENNPQIQEELNTKPENPLEIAEAVEFEHKYLEILEKLTPQCRKVFEMSRLQGRKNQEIANELGVSKRTVESHISQALKVLRKKLVRYVSGLVF